MKYFTFTLCFFKMTLGICPVHVDYTLVRNVGQGQWITHVTNDTCEHYDFGGELLFHKKIKRRFISQCSDKKNILNLTHADLDHYSFVELIFRNSRSVCWKTKATDDLSRFNLDIPFCSEEFKSPHQIVFYDNRGSNKNYRSTVYALEQFLIPGDSPMKLEKIWIKNISALQRKKIKLLILGHHGSRTSTGLQLLKQLPELKMAKASARYKKYRHPSPEVVLRLRSHLIPLLKTEDWGDILIL